MKLVLNAWLISISETRRHRQRAVYPADAAGACLKDARLALSLAEPHTMPGLETIAELWQQAADAGYAGEDLSAVYQWLSPSSKA